MPEPPYVLTKEYVQLPVSESVSPPGYDVSSFAASMSAMSAVVEQGTMKVEAADRLAPAPDPDTTPAANATSAIAMALRRATPVRRPSDPLPTICAHEPAPLL